MMVILRLIFFLAVVSLVADMIQPASGFLSANNIKRRMPNLFMDHSSATVFKVGDEVTVVEDVMKAGKNLRGRSGEVIDTWETCDVDPTCCCAEWVDDGLSVHVRFVAEENALFANNTFIHYFAESELVMKQEPVTKETKMTI